MGNKYSKGEPQFNVEKVKEKLIKVYQAIHPSFTDRQIENFSKTLSPVSPTTENITSAFVKATEALEFSIFGKIDTSDNLDLRVDKLLIIPTLQDELANMFSHIMGDILQHDPFTGDGTSTLLVHHRSHKFHRHNSYRSGVDAENTVRFQGSKSIGFRNINDKPYPINIVNSDYYSFNLIPPKDVSYGSYGGTNVTVCLESKIQEYKNSLTDHKKIEKAICNLESKVFGHANLCYPDLRGRVILLKRKLDL